MGFSNFLHTQKVPKDFATVFIVRNKIVMCFVFATNFIILPFTVHKYCTIGWADLWYHVSGIMVACGQVILD